MTTQKGVSSRLNFVSVPRRFDGIRKRASDRAGRFSLRPLLNLTFDSVSEDQPEIWENLALEYDHAGRVWRGRLLALKSHGAVCVQNPKRLIYARNCPEAGVWHDQKYMIPCGIRQICPWCWYRSYTQDLFEALWFFLFGNVTHPEPTHAYDLHLCRVTEIWERELPLASAYDRIQELRPRKLEELVDYEGAFQIFTVSPSDRRVSRRPGWKITQHVLAVTTQGTPGFREEFVREELAGLRFRSCLVDVGDGLNGPGLTANSLVPPVGYTCLYPLQLLRGSIDQTVEILNHRSQQGQAGSRLCSYYGALRNKRQRSELGFLNRDST